LNWRALARSRHFHAAWIGLVLLALGIAFGILWIWLIGIMLIAGALLLISWLVSLWKAPSRDSSDS
jgi:hypothetical protein